MNNFQDFTNLYSLSKTLRFELIPIGETKNNIESKGFLSNDGRRAADYKRAKQIIDEYHKAYIDKCLADFYFIFENCGKNDSLQEYYTCIKDAQTSNKDTLEKIQTNLRKQVANHLCKTEEFKRIDKKELFTDDLPHFVSPDDLELINEFKSFTTYFGGFHQNRRNMYSAEAKSTAIAYRLIHENLPKFIDNISVFNKITDIPEIVENIHQLCKDFELCQITEMFTLQYFNSVLTQPQIALYNAVIGGRSEGEIKIKGLNEYINLYNQKHKESRLPKFKALYKQILSDREHLSWLPEQFCNDNELLSAIKKYYDSTIDSIKNLRVLLESIGTYDLTGIFLRNDLQLTNISKHISGDWSKIQKAIIDDLKQVRKPKKREDAETYENELNKLYKKQGSFSIDYINETADIHAESYFTNLGAENRDEIQRENIFARIDNAYTEARYMFEGMYPEHKKLIQSKDDVALIKSFLDSMLELLRFVKPLLGTGEEADKDNRFYGEFMPIWEQLNLLTPLYNMVRNYVTRKPYSIEKVKLNFESPQLLGGWDKNKEKDCLSVILRKDGKYYLGVIDKHNTKIFNKYPANGDCYEKMVYKQIAIATGVGGFIRKCAGTAKRYGWNCPTSCLNYEGKVIIKDDEAKDNLVEIIDCQKDFFNKYEKDGYKYCEYGFKFKPSENYAKLSDFYKDIEEQRYKIVFQPISVAYIDSLVKDGKLYLFQIYNKDFSEYSKGTPNTHTLYWKMLFDERNLSDIVYQLNGGAELFYRERSIVCNKPTHAANMPIKNKNTQNLKRESLFEYDLIKNKRFTIDKFQFHVPMTLNFKSMGNDNINAQVRSYLHLADDVHVIGIDRGERNLLYLVVINSAGHICKQISLNEICNTHNGNTYKTNYHSLLDEREQKRQQERQSWQTIEGIKELKEGYLSQVIHKIAELMIEYKAIVVLEDLNMGFMRGRQKVEKTVYQKFEKMLIDKLKYLVDKKADPALPGGLLRAYQLANKFDSFAKLGKQSGFLFYVPAWNTSKIDPVTGFVNLLDLRYESEDKTKVLLSKFDSIHYNEDRDWFEFRIDYDKFTTKAQGTQTKWTICTYGTRIETFRNPAKNSQWDSREINLTQEFKALFEGLDIGGNLKNTIMEQSGKLFFERLLYLLRLTMQLRNSITGSNVDYIISPVANDCGEFFDSRNADASLPQDADANGAYNIARKGLMIVEQLKATNDPQGIKFDLSNKHWLQFAQQK